HHALRAHLRTFLETCNFAKRLKTIRGPEPFAFIAGKPASEPHRFSANHSHLTPKPNSQRVDHQARTGRKETALADQETGRAAARHVRPVSPLTRLGEIVSETIARATQATRAGIDDGARARRDAFEVARDHAEAEWRRMALEARREAERDPFSIHRRPPEQRMEALAPREKDEPLRGRAFERPGCGEKATRIVEELFRRDVAEKAREATAPVPAREKDRGLERYSVGGSSEACARWGRERDAVAERAARMQSVTADLADAGR
ncbi:MAG: hypothetical protein AAF321_04090, partial [Pseudomonadota bacterium]